MDVFGCELPATAVRSASRLPSGQGEGSNRGEGMRKYGVVLALAVSSVVVFVASASAISSPQVFNLLDVSQDVEQPIGGFTFDRPPVGGDQFAIYDKLYKW